MISDQEIDMVLRLVDFYFEQTKGFRGNQRKKYIIDQLHGALHNKQSGVMEGACPRCFGTGYEPEDKT